jgi:hypothetical protein
MVVGNLLGKLFGGDSGKTETVLRAYGKLPLYAEYRRMELAPGTPTAFSQWMDAGRLAWVRSATKSDHGVTRASRLVINLPGAKEVIVANVWDSRDSLGRVFPFSFFAVCSIEALGDNALQRWVSASAMHRTFEGFHEELGRIGRGGDFYKLYKKRNLTIRPDDLDERVGRLEAEARGVPAEEWYKSAVNCDGVTPGAWFAGVLRRGEKWKANGELAANLALNIPLAGDVPFGLQAAAWLRWSEGIVAKTGKTAQVIMPADRSPAPVSFNLIVRDVLADDFQLLTTDDLAYDFVEKVARMPQAGDSTVPPEVPVEGSLYDWLLNHAPS